MGLREAVMFRLHGSSCKQSGELFPSCSSQTRPGPGRGGQKPKRMSLWAGRPGDCQLPLRPRPTFRPSVSSLLERDRDDFRAQQGQRDGQCDIHAHLPPSERPCRRRRAREQPAWEREPTPQKQEERQVGGGNSCWFRGLMSDRMGTRDPCHEEKSAPSPALRVAEAQLLPPEPRCAVLGSGAQAGRGRTWVGTGGALSRVSLASRG